MRTSVRSVAGAPVSGSTCRKSSIIVAWTQARSERSPSIVGAFAVSIRAAEMLGGPCCAHTALQDIKTKKVAEQTVACKIYRPLLSPIFRVETHPAVGFIPSRKLELKNIGRADVKDIPTFNTNVSRFDFPSQADRLEAIRLKPIRLPQSRQYPNLNN